MKELYRFFSAYLSLCVACSLHASLRGSLSGRLAMKAGSPPCGLSCSRQCAWATGERRAELGFTRVAWQTATTTAQAATPVLAAVVQEMNRRLCGKQVGSGGDGPAGMCVFVCSGE